MKNIMLIVPWTSLLPFSALQWMQLQTWEKQKKRKKMITFPKFLVVTAISVVFVRRDNVWEQWRKNLGKIIRTETSPGWDGTYESRKSGKWRNKQWGERNMHVSVFIKWAAGLTVMTEFHDQGFCVKALTAGGLCIQMFEVKRPGQNQFS